MTAVAETAGVESPPAPPPRPPAARAAPPPLPARRGARAACAVPRGGGARGPLPRKHRDFGAAEDAVQEALLDASMQWPREGVPDNPAGWLYTTAQRRLTDQQRSDIARRRREEQMQMQAIDEQFEPEQDDTLALLFMCAHPSLTPVTTIALTLRAVGGLTTRDIGAAFFVSEATMAQRISRAKQVIKESSVPFSLPSPQERAERLDAVMHVVYLVFNEGYASSPGDELQRVDLSRAA